MAKLIRLQFPWQQMDFHNTADERRGANGWSVGILALERSCALSSGNAVIADRCRSSSERLDSLRADTGPL